MKGMVIIVLLATALMLGCTQAPENTTTPQTVSATNVSLPNFVVRLSLDQGPTRTDLTVANGITITLAALNANFTIENTALGINTTILEGTTQVVRIAPATPGTYVLQCTAGCPPGKDTITITTL